MALQALRPSCPIFAVCASNLQKGLYYSVHVLCICILYNLKTRPLVLLMSARSDIPVTAGLGKYRPKILQVLKEIVPEVDPELILQQLSRMEIA